MNNEKRSGKLYLVSAGIGDPENLTLKAINIIKQADLLLAMPFVAEMLNDILAIDVEIIDAGHGLFMPLARQGRDTDVEIDTKEDKVRHMIRQAVEKGQTVVVVEFGDPALFGPQIGYLDEFRDLSPKVIPGVSSFNAANALLSQAVLSGENQRLLLTSIHGLESYEGSISEQLVLFTMRMEIPQLSEKLLEHYAPDTQVALVFYAGFKEREEVHYTPLSQLADLPSKLNIPWECLVYVGNLKEV